MYLTQATLQPQSASLRAILQQQASRDRSHRLIWTLFDSDPEARRDFLWRETKAGERYLIQSQRPPRDAQAGLWVLETRELTLAFDVGERLRFLLRANPVRARPGAPARDKRVDVVMHRRFPLDAEARRAWSQADTESALLDWLYAREEKLGLRFDRAHCLAMSYQPLSVGLSPKDEPIRLTVADYQGLAEVTDPAALAAAVTAGVGKGKAFGCGLLLLRPA